MKKVKVKVLKTYKDLELKRTVKKGETIQVTEERAKKILASRDKLAEIVQVETNPLPKAAQVTMKPKPKVTVDEVVTPKKKKKAKNTDAKDNGKKD